MSLTLTLTDTQDTVTYTMLEVPFTTEDVEGKSEITTLSGDVYVDYLYNKRRWTHRWATLSEAEYNKLRGFYERQFTTYKFPLLSVPEYGVENVPVVMNFSARKTINQCLRVEDVEITLRETVQQ